ncbi:helix-turn-helix transcriptional regulator [Actinoplanes cyaneus]
MFSKFHFTRIFQRVTGLSPGRFLSALRIQRAKHLLAETSLNVADISALVGYNSVGTFSTRFARSIGHSPTAYRRLVGTPRDHGMGAEAFDAGSAVIRGNVRAHPGIAEQPMFVGLFADRIRAGRPVRCAILARPGPFRFERVPRGTWYLVAQTIGAGAGRPGRPDMFPGLPPVDARGPVTIHRDTAEEVVDLRPAPRPYGDPAVLLALLDAPELVQRVAPVGAGRRSVDAVGTGPLAA